MTITLKKYEKFLGLIFLFLMSTVLPTAMSGLWQLLPISLDDTQKSFVLFLINMIITVLIFHRYLWNSLRHSLGRPGKTLLWFAIGLAICTACTVLTDLLLARFVPDFVNANDAGIESQVQSHWWLMFFNVVFFAPITEETLFRGLVFGAVRKKSRLAAYLISMVVFSAIHLIGYMSVLSPTHLLLSFLQYLPSSFALALACDKADSVWGSILVHMSVNLIAILTVR